MSDRDAKLKIGVDASEMGPAAEKVGKLGDAIEKVGDAGGTAASGLNKTADSLEKVESAEAGVTQAAGEATSALSGVGESASESTQAAAEGASRAEQAIAGVTDAAGEEARALQAAGASAVEASAESVAAVEQVTAAEQEAAAAAQKLADETERAAAEAEGFAAGIDQVEELAEALRKSGVNAEIQKKALSDMLGELDKVAQKQIESGAGGQDAANRTGQAILNLKAKLADVNAEIGEEVDRLRTVGVEGPAAMDGVAVAAFDLETTFAKAFAKMRESVDQLETNLAITPGQLRETSNAVTAVEIAMVQAGERGQAVTLEQLALYERLQNQLRELTAQANKFTNASRDNAVGLKQTGAQVAGLSSGVQQLTAMLGPNAAKIGMVVGNVGQLGNVMEGLDASVKALDLNTLSATASTGKLAGQAGLVAVVFAAAAAAGVKLAQANEQNAEVTENLWQATKKYASDLGGDFKDSLSGWQSAMQSILIAIDDVVLNAAELGTTQEETEKTTRSLTHAFNEFAVSLFSGQSGIKLYNVALRDGLKEEGARKLALEDNVEVMKFYEASLKAGGQGHALWLAALRESQGDTTKMLEFIRRNNDQMQLSIKLTATATEREREHAAAVRAGIDIAKQKGEESARLSAAEEMNIARVTAGRRQLEQATNGTTATLTRELIAVQAMIGESARHAEALRDSAAAIAEVTANTDNLSPKQRARLEEIAEMISRGEELTESDRRYVDVLAAAIIANDKSVVSLKARAEASAAVKEITDSLVEAVQAEASAHDENESAIAKAVAAAEKLLASNTPLDAAERMRLSTIVMLGKEVSALAEAQDKANAATAASAQVQSAAGQVEAELIVVKSGKVDWLQREIDVRAEVIKSLALEKTGTDAVADSSEKAQAVQKLAHGVYTNVIEDQQKVAGATKGAGDAAEKAAGQFGDILVHRLENGRIQITNTADAAANASTKLEGIGESAKIGAQQFSESMNRFDEASTLLDPCIKRISTLSILLDDIDGKLDGVTTKFEGLGRAVESAGDKATQASGYSQTKVRETG